MQNLTVFYLDKINSVESTMMTKIQLTMMTQTKISHLLFKIAKLRTATARARIAQYMYKYKIKSNHLESAIIYNRLKWMKLVDSTNKPTNQLGWRKEACWTNNDAFAKKSLQSKVNVALVSANPEMMRSNQILTINGFIRSLQWQNKEKLFC